MIKTNVEFARPEDIPQLVSLGFKAFNESGISKAMISPDLDKSVISMTEFVTEHVVFVMRDPENEKIINGAIVLFYTDAWWSNKTFLQCGYIYFKEEARSYKSVRNLLKVVQEYAIMNEIPVVIDLFTKNNNSKKVALFKRLGFEEIGTNLVFNGKR